MNKKCLIASIVCGISSKKFRMNFKIFKAFTTTQNTLKSILRKTLLTRDMIEISLIFFLKFSKNYCFTYY